MVEIVKQTSTKLLKPIDTDKNVFDLLDDRVKRTPDEEIIRYRDADGAMKGLTGTAFRAKVVALAKGFIAKGFMPGDSIAILASTSWQWTALDFAITSIGCVVVPVYETNSPAQIKTICNDSTVKCMICGTDTQRDKVMGVKDECPTLRDIYVLATGAIDAICELGEGVSDEEFEERRRATHGDVLATIVYTSGSTGTPKGIELTHANFLFPVYSGFQYMPEFTLGPDQAMWLFLPLAHVFARYMQFICIAGNVQLGLGSNFKTIIKDFQDSKPTLILAVPRVFEKVYNAASQRAGTGFKGRLFNRAAVTARDWSRAQQAGTKLPLGERIRYNVYKKVVYSKIIDVFGGRAERAISGGAAIAPDLSHFFNGIGMPLLEGYGMTETTGPCSVSPFHGYKIGTIGLPLNGMTFGIAKPEPGADYGELLVKSPSVCRGYHNHPELTEQQITDGWLHTGDLAVSDDDGFTELKGRKKDIIITAGGKNVSPGELEAAVMKSEIVDQCLVIGDGKPFVAALVTLDLDGVNDWLATQGGEPVKDLEEAAKNPAVHAEVERLVDAANSQVSRAESIREFRILPDVWSVQNEMLTPSLKARRNVIVEHYRKLIDTDIYIPRKNK
ncbi:MAG: AMP-dependent synthetase/ligase [Bifidobacteriaceae bacterium]|nr:AMP-dependent synthetase/ligase [Bifidobacteriaceae bacterium]